MEAQLFSEFIFASQSSTCQGPLLERFGHQAAGWAVITLVGMVGLCAVFVPNTRALWAAEVDNAKKEAKVQKDIESRKLLISVGSEEDRPEMKNQSAPNPTCCTPLKQAYLFLHHALTCPICANTVSCAYFLCLLNLCR